MLGLIYLFIILGIVLVAVGLTNPYRYRLRPLQPVSEVDALRNKFKMCTYLGKVVPFSAKLLEKFRIDVKIKSSLDAAHVKLLPVEFFNLKILVMAGLAVAAFFAVGKINPWTILGGLALGYIIPDFWLRRQVAKRRYMIGRLLPEIVDLLGLCVEAGLDFTTAVRWIIEKIPSNPLLEELAFVLEEIKWGKPRSQALKDMSKRLNIPEVSSFVQTLVQAERMGTPVAEAFAILSEDTRLQRFHHGERIAMQAPIKILIPLIFCILPVIGIIIGGPIFLQFMQGGLLKGLGG